MTQYYTYRGFSLRRAPTQIRVLITVFVLVLALSVGVGIVNYQVRTGLTASGSAAWYRGSPAGPGQEAGAADSGSGAARAQEGPAAGPLAATPLREKSPLELLDATHPHLFNQAFLFFVLGHIVALCAMKPRRKMALYVAGFLAVLVDTASPWLIRYVSSSMSWLQLTGHVLMAGAFVGMVGVPLREMWLRGGRGDETAGSAEDDGAGEA